MSQVPEEGFTPEQSAAEPYAGKRFTVDTDVTGRPAGRYRPEGERP
ncbi:hypothetical protein ACGFMK_40670 [Amycolatopsis sp. NPDC049252]